MPLFSIMPSGKSDQNTIRKIYNQEQLESEEINLDLQDIANGVPLPPNRAHQHQQDHRRDRYRVL